MIVFISCFDSNFNDFIEAFEVDFVVDTQLYHLQR